MFLHLSVSHSVHRGVCFSACWDITTPTCPPPPPPPLGADIPLEQTPPRSRHSWDQAPPEQTPPQEQTPLWDQAPPQQMATVVDGTYPTGMHSCSHHSFNLNFKQFLGSDISVKKSQKRKKYFCKKNCKGKVRLSPNDVDSLIFQLVLVGQICYKEVCKFHL